MSKKAWLLTKDDVPKYIKEIASRLSPVMMSYKDEDGFEWYGYVYKLNAKWKCGYESQLVKDTEALVKWCKGWHAHSKIIKYTWWNEVYTEGTYKSRVYKARKNGFRNHSIIVISDPVALRFERDGFYR